MDGFIQAPDYDDYDRNTAQPVIHATRPLSAPENILDYAGTRSASGVS